MIRVAKERTRSALVWAWIRFWRQPLRGNAISTAKAIARPFVDTPEQHNQVDGELEHIEEKIGGQGQGKSEAQDRQQQALKLVSYYTPVVPFEKKTKGETQ